MRIKHFAGYGSVEATKVSKKTIEDYMGNQLTELVVKVKGNHEWGLIRDDTYDLYNWLIKRFDKSVGDYNSIWIDINYTHHYATKNDVAECTYTFTYTA